jgi:hypothetical protein
MKTILNAPLRMMMLTVLACLAAGACNTPVKEGSDTASTETAAGDGFVDLLAGGTLDAWRNYRADTISGKWEVVDGVLGLSGEGGGDIVTRDVYDNFELDLEWKISPKGNSGIFFHVVEADSLDRVYYSGPEIQVLDNDGHKDGKIPTHRAGDNYDLQACSVETVKPVGEWNQVRIVVNNGHVEQWLNGTLVVEYQIGSPEWEAQYQASKFKQWPVYGRAGKGHIALQDHGDPVWFRNIRVKTL